MRLYGIVSPMFWTGTTGKNLRAERDAQVIACYLMTGPHAHQTGLYYLPLMYLCHETGIAQKGASKGLQILEREQFSVYDPQCEWVWVCEMAAWQIGRELTPNDKRVKGVHQYLLTVPRRPFKGAFIKRYQTDFHLGSHSTDPKTPENVGPLEGVKRGSEGASSYQNITGSEQTSSPLGEEPIPPEPTDPPPAVAKPKASKSVPDDFAISPEDRQTMLAELPADFDIDEEQKKFRDHQFRDAHTDWLRAWRNWMRRARDEKRYARKTVVAFGKPKAIMR